MGANKAKGTRWETAITKYLRDAGHTDARRVVQTGRSDEGDIHVWRMALQAKDAAAHDLSGWLTAAEKQAGHAGLPYGAVVLKRRRHTVGEAYVVLSLNGFAKLLSHIRTLEGK